MMMNTLTFIPIYQWRSLCVVNIEPLLDCLFVIIRTAALLSTENQTVHQLVLGNEEFNHGSHVMTAISQHLLQCFSLRDSTWETVEDNPLMLLAEAVVNAGKNINHQLIRNELTIIYVSLGCFTQSRTVLDFVTEDIPRRDVTETILPDHLVTLGTFAGTRRTENYNILHYSFTKV